MAVAGLVRIDLPGGGAIRLAEGAAVKWGAETYVPFDPVHGALGGVEATEEGIGVEVPAMQLTVLPPSVAGAAALVQPGAQKARVRAWLVEYDRASASVTAAGDPLFDGFLDQAVLVRGDKKLELRCQVVANTERLLELNIGNSLSPTFHKSVWPDETGEDNATGLSIPVAWGVESPPRQGVGVGSGSGWAGGFAGRTINQVL